MRKGQLSTLFGNGEKAEMSKLLEASKFYHSLGWHLIPISKNSKVPLFPWTEYQSRQATPEELGEWFGKKDYNIGLVCGEKSGIAVIDDDSYKAQGGQIKLASSLTVKTPRGGIHYYFQCPKDLRPSVNDELAVDIRANGSYVLLPPSTISSKPYTWNVKSKEDFKKIPMLPLAYLGKIQPQNSLGLGEHISVDFNKIFETKEGSRDISLYRAACSLLAKGIPAKLVYLFLVFLGQSFKPQMGEVVVRKKFESAVNFLLREKK